MRKKTYPWQMGVHTNGGWACRWGWTQTNGHAWMDVSRHKNEKTYLRIDMADGVWTTHGGKMPRMCLGGMKTQVGELESHECQVDKSSSHVSKLRGQARALTVLNTDETVIRGNSGGTGEMRDMMELGLMALQLVGRIGWAQGHANHPRRHGHD